jgi:hypothetical protein
MSTTCRTEYPEPFLTSTQELKYLFRPVEVGIASPGADNSLGMVDLLGDPLVVLGSDDVCPLPCRLPKVVWLSGPVGVEVHDRRCFETPKLAEADDAADSGVVLFCVSGRRVEHHPEDQTAVV